MMGPPRETAEFILMQGVIDWPGGRARLSTDLQGEADDYRRNYRKIPYIIGLCDKVLATFRDKLLVKAVTKCSWITQFFHRTLA
jgi:hypothetical protein